MITLSQDDVKGLFEYLNEQPTKFSVPIMNFINGKIEQQKKEEDAQLKQADPPQSVPSPPVIPFVPEAPLSADEINDIEVEAPQVVAYDDPIDD